LSREKPLIYSCSGYSAAAQLANALAVELDRGGVAEMSCIAGVGGGVPQLVAIARSGRAIVALDGCPLHCVASCLRREGVAPTVHVTLSEIGAKKVRHAEATDELRDVARRHVLHTMRAAGFALK
jgi:uncharacterized metal-binding protein